LRRRRRFAVRAIAGQPVAQRRSVRLARHAFPGAAAYDVVVDLRRGPNYRRWIAAPLCADNGEALMNA
jgi:hypothetical protein